MSLTKAEADTLIAAIRGFVNDERDTRPPVNGKRPGRAVDLTLADGKGALQAGDAAAPLTADGRFTVADMELLYQAFKNRLIDDCKVDPVLLHLVTTRPEIIVDVERQVVELTASNLKGRVARLLAAGWFTETRSTSAVRRELARTGADPGGGGSLSDNLAQLQRDGFLVRDGDGWTQAPGITVTERTLEK